MNAQKLVKSFLESLRPVCVLSGMVVIVAMIINYELHYLMEGRELALWVQLFFVFSAFIVHMSLLDVLFCGWAKLRFDMYVVSGVVRKNGAKFERGVYVKMENQEYFIPVGQELVLRNSSTGNAQIVTGPESKPRVE